MSRIGLIAQKDILDAGTKTKLCLLLTRLQWAIETTKHIRSVLDRRVLYYTVSWDDTQSPT